MGIPEKRRAVYAMVRRWERDEERLQNLFRDGKPVDTDDFTDAGEMLRNLGSAIAYASGFLVATESRVAVTSGTRVTTPDMQ